MRLIRFLPHANSLSLPAKAVKSNVLNARPTSERLPPLIGDTASAGETGPARHRTKADRSPAHGDAHPLCERVSGRFLRACYCARPASMTAKMTPLERFEFYKALAPARIFKCSLPRSVGCVRPSLILQLVRPVLRIRVQRHPRLRRKRRRKARCRDKG